MGNSEEQIIDLINGEIESVCSIWPHDASSGLLPNLLNNRYKVQITTLER